LFIFFIFASVVSIDDASSKTAFDSNSMASFSSCDRAARSAKFLAEDRDIGDLSHEGKPAGLRWRVFSRFDRGMSYEVRDRAKPIFGPLIKTWWTARREPPRVRILPLLPGDPPTASPVAQNHH
jgi:hypothetical protein